MRRLRHTLAVVTATVAVVLMVGLRTASLAEAGAAPPQETPPQAQSREAFGQVESQPARDPQRPVLFASVVRPFGATIRAVPATDATALFNTRCGEVWPVVAVDRGWVKVKTGTGAGWIGGSRVVVSSAPPTVDCSDARFIFASASVATTVTDGCLSLRSRPAADAPALACVDDGHLYTVLDGPFDPGSGDDWFRVSSPGTGSGWALGEHLRPG